jgi:hypothetical protein
MFFTGEKEPTYKGKTLTEWLYWRDDWLKMPLSVGLEANQIDCEEAVRAIGTNAFPKLIKMLSGHDGAFKSKIAKVVNGQTLIKFHIRTADERAEMSVWAIYALGTSARPLLPEIIQFGTNGNPIVRFHAVDALRSLVFGDLEGARSEQSVIYKFLRDRKENESDLRVKKLAWITYFMLNPVD